jgi:hypothetical protein
MTKREISDAWGEWIASMGEWHVFGGLTYRQLEGKAPPGADVVRAHARRWLREAPRACGRPVEAAVIALEYQRNGWPHLHPIVRLPGGLHPGDLATLGTAWYRQHGIAKLEVPRSAPDVCRYAAKYLSKDLNRGDVIFWPPRGPLSVHQPGFGRQLETRARRA